MCEVDVIFISHYITYIAGTYKRVKHIKELKDKLFEVT